MLKPVFLLMAILSALGAASAAGELPIPENALWEPIVDEVYLQEVGSLIETSSPLNAVAVFQGKAYVGDMQGVAVVDGETLKRLDVPLGNVTRLRVLNDALWGASPKGLFTFDGAAWSLAADVPVTDMCLHNGHVAFASGTALYTIDGAVAVPLAENSPTELLGIAPYSGTIYVHDGKRVGLLERGKVVYDEITDWGSLEHGCSIRNIMSYGSRLYVATDEGLCLLRGMTWYHIRGEDGLCYEDTTCLAPGFARELWIGTMRGAIRNAGGEYQFLGYPRWIPHDKVNAIACGDSAAYLATDGGLGIIAYEPYTLAKKAAYYERWLDEWGQKRLGFIHSLFLLDGEWQREVSDNDVGYSSHYLHAKCFEYAVTGNLEARAEAVDMMKSMKWSEEITPIDGFPARSIYAVNEPCLKAQHGSGGLPAEWHATPDGVWEWKGDTSSDEIDAHVYATTVFLHLIANDEERPWVTEHLHRVIGHIVDNGFCLRDVDGQPTRWARWDPEYLQTPYGYYARGLNGMEAFNYMTTAYYFTRDPKFLAAKEQLIGWDYFGDILRQKLTFPAGAFTHFDDRLAFYAYFPLIQHETEPELKTLWLRSLERSWEVKRIEAVPWFNFIYGALTGNDCETRRAVDHLRAWPLDLRRHSYTNSHRDDLYPPNGCRTYAGRPKPLTPREGEPNRWDGDFMQLDGTLEGKVVADPGGWLDAYWMGRYYGMITAPRTDDTSLTTVPDRGLHLGAKPYAGPPRPQLRHEQ
ncbi:MAG TPA: hypothetical protein PKY01_09145 [Candidatus Hydrogenedentes bacterium]|nr:hypothetical protein [Candidatus Hydrogenedentota bacterium]